MTQPKRPIKLTDVRPATIIHGVDALMKNARSAVVALGNFDGVHRGHREVIMRAVEKAKALQCAVAVMTFEPHPLTFFTNKIAKEFRLSDSQSKARLLGAMGVDYVIEMPFNNALSKLTADAFVKDILLDKCDAQHIVCGYDFAFGHQRSGDVSFLKKASQALGFGFDAVEAVGKKNEIFSSSIIRQSLVEGELLKANEMLGHYHLLHGEVIEGDKRGRKIGFPTANIKLDNVMAPACGVYAAWVNVEGEKRQYKAVLNIGMRPTFDKETLLMEVHFLEGKTHQLYGKILWVQLVEFIRPEKKFENIELLVASINRDAEKAGIILFEKDDE